MKEKELRNIVQQKNDLIIRQTRRISQLEEKLAEVRHKYFELKYDGDKMGFILVGFKIQ
jgi:hypothetical protein